MGCPSNQDLINHVQGGNEELNINQVKRIGRYTKRGVSMNVYIEWLGLDRKMKS